MSTNKDAHLHPDKIADSSLANIISATIFLALSIVCVALRFLHRMRTRSLWWDDWTILLALAAGIGVYVTLVLDSIPSGGASGYLTDQYTSAGLYTWGRVSIISPLIRMVSSNTNQPVMFLLPIYSLTSPIEAHIYLNERQETVEYTCQTIN